MTNEEIMNGLKEIITLVRPNVDLANVTMDSNLLTDLGMDSLMLMLMALAIENKFSIQFNTQNQFEKVSDVVDYISQNIK